MNTLQAQMQYTQAVLSHFRHNKQEVQPPKANKVLELISYRSTGNLLSFHDISQSVLFYHISFARSSSNRTFRVLVIFILVVVFHTKKDSSGAQIVVKQLKFLQANAKTFFSSYSSYFRDCCFFFSISPFKFQP